MTTEIVTYNILFFGSPEGFRTKRAQIALHGDNGIAGYIHFHDQGMAFEADREDEGVVHMQMPSSMLAPVVDMLRNEEPLYLYFSHGKSFLSTSFEAVGEGEEEAR